MVWSEDIHRIFSSNGWRKNSFMLPMQLSTTSGAMPCPTIWKKPAWRQAASSSLAAVGVVISIVGANDSEPMVSPSQMRTSHKLYDAMEGDNGLEAPK